MVTIATKSYQDIRYDRHGDGKKIIWLIVKDNLEITETLVQSKLTEVRIQKNLDNHRVVVQYALDSNNVLRLKFAKAFPKVMHFQSDACGTYLPEIRRDKSFTKNLLTAAGTDISQHLDSNCKSVLTEGEYNNFLAATAKVYDLDLNIESKNVRNEFISCLSSDQSAEEEIPNFVKKIASYKTESPSKFKIDCATTTDDLGANACVKGSYDEKENLTKLTFRRPKGSDCPKDMTVEISKAIFHECLHPEESEERIVELGKICPKDPNEDADLQESINLLNKHRAEEKLIVITHGFAAKDTAAAKTESQIADVKVSPEIAAGNLLPAGGKVSTEVPSNFDQAYSSSQKQTAPAFSTASKLLASVVVPSAYAATPAGTSKASGAKNTFGLSAPTKVSNVAATKISPVGKISTTTADSSASKEIRTIASVHETGAAANPKEQSQPHREFATPSNAKASLGSQNISAVATGNSPAPNLTAGSANDSVQKLKTGSAIKETSSPQKSQDTQETIASRNQELQKISAFGNYNEALTYFQNNRGKLNRLGILVLTANNESFGAKPDQARVFIRERNNRFVQVNE